MVYVFLNCLLHCFSSVFLFSDLTTADVNGMGTRDLLDKIAPSVRRSLNNVILSVTNCFCYNLTYRVGRTEACSLEIIDLKTRLVDTMEFA